MKRTRLSGRFGDLMKRHLQLRRSLGYQLRAAERALDQFDIYVAENFPASRTVTRSMVTGYLRTMSDLHLITRHRQLTMLRQFCRFLFQLNPETYIPEAHLLRAAKSDFQPHVYTLSEVIDLMNAAQRLPPAGSLRPHTYSTLIGLLWVSGLRGGEVVRLNLEDVDLERGVLHIRQTKNFKSRLVPLTDTSQTALLAYRDMRCRLGMDQSPQSPFFMNERKCRCAHRTVDETFRMLTRELGLMSPYGREPRLHDYATRGRHDVWPRSIKPGRTPMRNFPVLATYLGHMNIACTTVYLHPSTDLLVQAGTRFQDHVNAVPAAGAGGQHE